jgi:hypothetical protein
LRHPFLCFSSLLLFSAITAYEESAARQQKEKFIVLANQAACSIIQLA